MSLGIDKGRKQKNIMGEKDEVISEEVVSENIVSGAPVEEVAEGNDSVVESSEQPVGTEEVVSETNQTEAVEVSESEEVKTGE